MEQASLEAAAAIPACLCQCIHCGKDDFEGEDDEEEVTVEEEEEEAEGDEGDGNGAAKNKHENNKKRKDNDSPPRRPSFGPRTMIICTCCQVYEREKKTMEKR